MTAERNATEQDMDAAARAGYIIPDWRNPPDTRPKLIRFLQDTRGISVGAKRPYNPESLVQALEDAAGFVR